MNIFYSKLNEYLDAKHSKTAYRKFMKENPDFDRDTLDRVTASQKAMDFYPTPEKCLNYEPITHCINEARHILEPCAGLGSMVHFIMKHKPARTKVDVNELNKNFIPILEKFFPKTKITQENFLEFPIQNDYDVIVCNPPFSSGYGKKDKFYLDFLFKCIYMLHKSTTATRERCLIFVCPRLVNNRETINTWKAGQFNGFDFREIIDDISFNKMNSIVKQVTGNELNKKEYKAFQQGEEYEDLDLFIPYQSEYVDTCEGFGGTGVNADVYRFIML